MKKIAASVGLIALGASALHAAETSTLNQMQQTKAWSVSATLRGFYDDNITGASDSVPANVVSSAGIELSPSVKYGVAGEQTSFNVGYSFTARYFDKKAPLRVGNSDYTHTFDADLAHAFSPRLDLLASEAFVIGQEPDLLRDAASTQPIEGDNIRNFASVDLNIDVTQLLAFSVGYDNALFDYDDEGPGTLPVGGAPGSLVTGASNSGLYDRMEHGVRLDSRWKLSPQTTGIIGYKYSQTSYTGDEPIAGIVGVAGSQVLSESRDNRGHRFTVGAEHVFNDTLSGSARVGAEFTDYINDPTGKSQWSPYLQGSLRYLYQATSSVDVGFSHNRSTANDAGGAGGTFARDSATTTVYGSVKHALASKLFVTGTASLRDSTYNAPGNAIDDQSFLFYQLGLDLSYEFNPNLSGHVGYNYDQLSSDLPGRDYDRNRIYLGVTAGF